MSNSTDMTVANTILQQLRVDGPFGALAAVGAREYVGGENFLQFKITIKRGVRNYIKVTLTPADTYTVELIKVRGTVVKTMETVENVYCDMLTDVVYRLGTPS